MTALRTTITVVLSSLIAIALLMGLATLGLVLLGALFVASLAAVTYAAWHKRSTITTTYSVIKS